MNNYLKLLNNNLTVITSISKQHQQKLYELGITRIIDLLLYFPQHIYKVQLCNNLKDIVYDKKNLIKCKVINYKKHHKVTKILCEDELGKTFYITFFKITQQYLNHYLAIDQIIYLLGIVKYYGNIFDFIHPKIINQEKHQELINKQFEREYKAQNGISAIKFANYIDDIFNFLNIHTYEEWLPQDIIDKHQLPSFQQAIYYMHYCKTDNYNDIYKSRLAIDELLAYYLLLITQRQQLKLGNIQLNVSNKIIKPFLKNLPFTLTPDQINAIKSIKQEWTQSYQQTILLQGDVGCGKTIICFIAGLFAIESGYQIAVMAPTSVLAKQHYQNFLNYTQYINLNIALLNGNTPSTEKQHILNDLKNNKINIIIGTHALITKEVQFANLGSIIIDEQHKFGVEQRYQLINKGKAPTLLLTTATPIPRTLALAIYGDIKYLQVTSKPLMRKEIKTSIVNSNKIPQIIHSLHNELLHNKKVFWICALVDDSDKLDYTSTKTRYQEMLNANILASQLLILHGQMNNKEKTTILEQFKNSQDGIILISTSVIEVGVDVPSCNIIIIEDANKYGLSQLHQLRGRVGRSDEQGQCLLIHNNKLTNVAKQRLKVMKESNDGFYIAQKDLEIRGFGELAGIHQSGAPSFKIINLDEHNKYIQDIIPIAKNIFNNNSYKYHINLFYIDHKNYLKQG